MASSCQAVQQKPVLQPLRDRILLSVAVRESIPVKVATLSRTKIARTIDYTATILPFEEVNMAPSTPGRIEKILC